MKKFLIGFGIGFFVLQVLSFAQNQDYTVISNSDGAEENTNSSVPEGMEVVSVKGHDLLVPKGSKVELNGSLLAVEDASKYMSRMFADMDMRFKKAEKQSQDMSRMFAETDMRLKKVENQLQDMSWKFEEINMRLKEIEQKFEKQDKMNKSLKITKHSSK